MAFSQNSIPIYIGATRSQAWVIYLGIYSLLSMSAERRAFDLFVSLETESQCSWCRAVQVPGYALEKKIDLHL